MADISYARTYTQRNGERPPWKIIPLKGKIPADKGGHGWKDASSDPKQIEKWWKQYPDANIGIATGEVNGLVVIDVDRNHGDGSVDGEETLKLLEEKLGSLPDTVEALTPGGGRHLYFRYPAGFDIRSRAADAHDLWPGIDVKANGGYVAAPPSVIEGANGERRAYEWEVCSYPNRKPLADLPAPWTLWLTERSGKSERFILPDPAQVVPGCRETTLFRYGCSMRGKGKTDREIAREITAYNSRLPVPMTDKQIGSICSDVAKYPMGTPAAGSRKSKPFLTADIVRDALRDMGCTVRYNQILCEYEITGRTPAGRPMTMEDLSTLLLNALADSFKRCTPDLINRQLTFLGRENSYNPVLDLLSAAPWDGRDRLGQLYALMGIEGFALPCSMTHKWLLQGTALLFNTDPDHAYGADGCLVFNGPQGTGKTSLFRHLAMKDTWFGEGVCIDERDKDTFRWPFTKFITELGEVECTLKKSDTARMKGLITRPEDLYRLPYAREDTKVLRHTNLCATCNSDRYLIDTTGNRRWWSIPFKGGFRHEELLELDAVQLWAQMYAKVAPMSREERVSCYRLTKDEQEELAERNGGYEKPVKGQEEVEDVLGMAERDDLTWREITVTEFWNKWESLRRYTSNQIGIALKKCGIEVRHAARGNVATLPVPEWDTPKLPFKNK